MGSAHAAFSWVAPGGDDGQPGSREQPFASIARGVQAARPGDTVVVRAGTYRGGLSWSAPGTAEQPFTLQAAGDGPVVVAGRSEVKTGWQPLPHRPGVYVAAETGSVAGVGLDVDTTPLAVDDVPAMRSLDEVARAYLGYYHDRAQGRLYIHLRNGEAPGQQAVTILRDGCGLSLSGAHVTVAGIAFRSFAAQGLAISSARSVTVRRCRVSQCGYVWSAGVQLHQATDVALEDCQLYRLRNGVIAQETVGLRLAHNTIYHTRAHGIYLISRGPVAVHDSIIYAGGGSGSALYIDAAFTGGLEADHNCYLDTGTPALISWMPLRLRFPTFGDYRAALPDLDEHSLSAEPLFVATAPGAEDLRLRPDSPCRGKAPDGSDLGARQEH